MRSVAAAKFQAFGVRSLGRLGILFVVLAILIAAPFLLWGDRFEGMLDRDRLADWLGGFQNTAWLAAIGLLVSDLLLPIPNTMIIAALGILYGPLLGGLIATIGNCLSGLLGYSLCRRFGRPFAARLLGEADLAEGERLFHHAGGWMVAGSRWLPILPETVACMAGLAQMRRSTFLLALLCGSAPLSFLIAGIGYAGADRPFLTLIVGAILPLLLWLLVRGVGAALTHRRPQAD